MNVSSNTDKFCQQPNNFELQHQVIKIIITNIVNLVM